MIRMYLFGALPMTLGCFMGGGGSAPAAPPPASPPPQIAKTPDAPAVRANTANQNIAQGRGEPKSTFVTGGMGDAIGDEKLSRKTLLGQAYGNA
ncbi:hypothetical protein [Methylomonas koyamae]|uniref:hypothetical protein n=1 Tax=Methylomonas koyamae TaxID=702114 RepID=UPI0016424BF6|nr:hypothetical protein [Methylomonas koyamae]